VSDSQRRCDGGKDPWQMGLDLLSRESDHSIAALLQIVLTLAILLVLPLVHGSVDLDDEIARRTAEVDDDAADGVLPAKDSPMELSAPEGLPEQLLAPGRRRAKAPCRRHQPPGERPCHTQPPGSRPLLID
jgi:hypothetical protein